MYISFARLALPLLTGGREFAKVRSTLLACTPHVNPALSVDTDFTRHENVLHTGNRAGSFSSPLVCVVRKQ